MSELPASLTRLLNDHRASHAPHYPPVANSDHGPMAYLALHGLGHSPGTIEAFAASYRQRLAPLPPARRVIQAEAWQTDQGRIESYPELVAFFDAEIASSGWRACLERYLPVLISRWVVDAFHPLIRLAYGVEFEVPSEISAGLAYLSCMDPELALDRALVLPIVSSSAQSLLEAMQTQRHPSFADGRFNDRYRHVLESGVLRPWRGALPRPDAELSRVCLEVFHATHDFFALHLVTGSHAFRVCLPWAGPGAQALFGLGITAGYLAIGAPTFQPLARSRVQAPLAVAAGTIDEHDIKLAYSCGEQARALGDATYLEVAEAYLKPRRVA